MIDYRKLYNKYDKEDLINTCINLKEYKERLRKEVNKSYMICNEKDKEIERLNNIINKVYKYLDEKKDVPEWWDTDFMICMDILKGGTGYLKDILGSDK